MGNKQSSQKSSSNFHLDAAHYANTTKLMSPDPKSRTVEMVVESSPISNSTSLLLDPRSPSLEFARTPMKDITDEAKKAIEGQNISQFMDLSANEDLFLLAEAKKAKKADKKSKKEAKKAAEKPKKNAALLQKALPNYNSTGETKPQKVTGAPIEDILFTSPQKSLKVAPQIALWNSPAVNDKENLRAAKTPKGAHHEDLMMMSLQTPSPCAKESSKMLPKAAAQRQRGGLTKALRF